jgi:hypothetical protein
VHPLAARELELEMAAHTVHVKRRAAKHSEFIQSNAPLNDIKGTTFGQGHEQVLQSATGQYKVGFD